MNDFIQPSDENQQSVDYERKKLVKAWLDHFGVDSAPDLDLGCLAAIADWVNAGIAPPSPR